MDGRWKQGNEKICRIVLDNFPSKVFFVQNSPRRKELIFNLKRKGGKFLIFFSVSKNL